MPSPSWCLKKELRPYPPGLPQPKLPASRPGATHPGHLSGAVQLLPFLCAAAGGDPEHPKAEEALGKARARHGLLQDEVGSGFEAAL